MNYNNIKISIRELLDREKLRFVSSNNIIEPISTYSPIKETMCIIITAPYEFETMQLVAEFDTEPGLDNIKKCYAVIGNSVRLFDIEDFLQIYNSNFSNCNSSIEKYDRKFYNKISKVYINLLYTNKTINYNNYIDFCTKLTDIRKKKMMSELELSGEEKTKTIKF